jgi:hypothetical protein
MPAGIGGVRQSKQAKPGMKTTISGVDHMLSIIEKLEEYKDSEAVDYLESALVAALLIEPELRHLAEMKQRLKRLGDMM